MTAELGRRDKTDLNDEFYEELRERSSQSAEKEERFPGANRKNGKTAGVLGFAWRIFCFCWICLFGFLSKFKPQFFPVPIGKEPVDSCFSKGLKPPIGETLVPAPPRAFVFFSWFYVAKTSKGQPTSVGCRPGKHFQQHVFC